MQTEWPWLSDHISLKMIKQNWRGGKGFKFKSYSSLLTQAWRWKLEREGRERERVTRRERERERESEREREREREVEKRLSLSIRLCFSPQGHCEGGKAAGSRIIRALFPRSASPMVRTERRRHDRGDTEPARSGVTVKSSWKWTLEAHVGLRRAFVVRVGPPVTSTAREVWPELAEGRLQPALHICACVCVSACVCACVRACVCGSSDRTTVCLTGRWGEWCAARLSDARCWIYQNIGGIIVVFMPTDISITSSQTDFLLFKYHLLKICVCVYGCWRSFIKGGNM